MSIFAEKTENYPLDKNNHKDDMGCIYVYTYTNTISTEILIHLDKHRQKFM